MTNPTTPASDNPNHPDFEDDSEEISYEAERQGRCPFCLATEADGWSTATMTHTGPDCDDTDWPTNSEARAILGMAPFAPETD